jgi:dihydrofolate reductase
VSAVFLDVNLSLNGCVAARGRRPDLPLGEGGDRIREWAMGPDAGLAPKSPATAGALICGRSTYDICLPLWGEAGAHPPAPVLVLSRGEQPAHGVYTFHAEPAAALEHARTQAGDRDICVMGGALAYQAFLGAGLVDEIVVHLVPFVFGGGTPMFEDETADLEVLEVVDAPGVTHIRYRVR